MTASAIIDIIRQIALYVVMLIVIGAVIASAIIMGAVINWTFQANILHGFGVLCLSGVVVIALSGPALLIVRALIIFLSD